MITFMRELLSYVLSSEESLTSIRSTTSMAPRPSFTSSSMALEKKQCVVLQNRYHAFVLMQNMHMNEMHGIEYDDETTTRGLCKFLQVTT